MKKETQKLPLKISEEKKEPAITTSFSLDYLYNFSNGDEQFVKDMVQTFLTEIPKAFEILEHAIIEKDWAIVHNTAHRLKSNFMMLGMKDQQLQSKTIEQMIKDKDIDQAKIEVLTKQIKEALALVFPLLTNEVV